MSIKGGSLDEPVDLREAVHIWTARALPGVVIPDGSARLPGEPDEGWRLSLAGCAPAADQALAVERRGISTLSAGSMASTTVCGAVSRLVAMAATAREERAGGPVVGMDSCPVAPLRRDW